MKTKYLRELMGYSQETFAKRNGVTRSALAMAEMESRSLKLATDAELKPLVKALKKTSPRPLPVESIDGAIAKHLNEMTYEIGVKKKALVILKDKLATMERIYKESREILDCMEQLKEVFVPVEKSAIVMDVIMAHQNLQQNYSNIHEQLPLKKKIFLLEKEIQAMQELMEEWRAWMT